MNPLHTLTFESFDRAELPTFPPPTSRGYTSAGGLRIGAGKDPYGDRYGWSITLHTRTNVSTLETSNGYPCTTLDEAWSSAQTALRSIVAELQKGIE